MERAGRGRAWSRAQLFGGVACGLAGGTLLHFVDDPCWAWLHAHANGVEWMAAARLPSLLLATAACLAFARPLLRWPSPSAWAAGLRPGLLWLGPMTAVLLWFHPARLVDLPRPVDRLAHFATGLLVEELVYRGAVLALAQKVLPRFPAVLLQAGLFSLSHAQYHRYDLAAAAPQMALTLALGVFLGLCADGSRSLWPAVVVHVVNNALAYSLSR